MSGAGPLTMTARAQAPAVTGPARQPNGRTPRRPPAPPAVSGARAADVNPCPLPPSAPVVLDAPPYTGGSPTGYEPISPTTPS